MDHGTPTDPDTAADPRGLVALRHLPDLVVVFDADRPVWASGSVVDLLGWTPAELLGMTVDEITHPEDVAVAEGTLAMLAEGHTVSGVARLRHRDGTWRWMESRICPVLEANGEYHGVAVHALRDATDAIRVAAELEHVARNFRVLAENASDVVVRGSNAGEFEWVSPSVTTLLGWKPEQLLGSRFVSLVHPDDVDLIRGAQSDVLHGEMRTEEVRLRAADGTYRWVEITARPLIEDGRVTGRVASWRDVEAERAAREARALSEARLRIVTDFAAELIVQGSTAGVCEWASPASRRVVGWDPGDLVGQTVRELIHPDDRDALAGARRRSEETGAPVPARVRFRTQAGSHRWVDITGNVVTVGGEVVGFVSVVRDAEAAVAAETSLRARAERFERLAQNASHLSMSRHGSMAWVSPMLAASMGYEPADLIGSHDERIHPDDLAAVPVARRQLRDGDGARVRVRYRHADDSYHWYDIVARPVPDPDEPDAFLTVSTWHPVDDEVAALRELEHRERRMRHEATHDPLTGLANRALVTQEIERALGAGGDPLAVLLVDLDHFKLVNDSLGHPMGDQLLHAAARRLERCLREPHVLARLGGDEFVVVLTEPADIPSRVATAVHICDAFRSPLDVDGRPLTTTASVGITVATSSSTPDTLLAEADAAMYFAKDAGRDRVSVFDDHLRATVDRRLTLENELHRVVERGELELHYQPEIDLRTGSMTGVEALLRWRHPDGTLRSAGEFIEVAEETGLILDIGDWVIHTAFAQTAEWQAMCDLVVRVNLSARQLSERDLLTTIRAAQETTGVDPRRISFEITETAIVRDMPAVRENLVALHDLGFGLAIDDFGTGYASLTYLSQFPVDVLKLDMSFVRRVTEDEGQRLLLGGVIALATSLGAMTTAEGVEQPAQAAVLRELGCTHGQGWLWDPALPPEEITRRLGAAEPGD